MRGRRALLLATATMVATLGITPAADAQARSS
jgi:hypothetical protein